MSTNEANELKLSLINWISGLTDMSILGSINNLRSSTSEGDWWDELTPEQQASLEEGMAQAKAGEDISSEEFWKRLDNA